MGGPQASSGRRALGSWLRKDLEAGERHLGRQLSHTVGGKKWTVSYTQKGNLPKKFVMVIFMTGPRDASGCVDESV